MDRKLLISTVLAGLMVVAVGCSGDAGSTDGEATDGGTATEAVVSENITVTVPAAGDSIASPFSVEGTTTADVERVYIEARDVNGDIIVETSALLDDDGSFSSSSIYYFLGGGDEGSVHVYTLDENDEEMDRTVVPVSLQ
jgi:hypothetical protein